LGTVFEPNFGDRHGAPTKAPVRGNDALHNISRRPISRFSQQRNYKSPFQVSGKSMGLLGFLYPRTGACILFDKW